MLWVRSLAQELLYATGAAEKRERESERAFWLGVKNGLRRNAGEVGSLEGIAAFTQAGAQGGCCEQGERWKELGCVLQDY